MSEEKVEVVQEKPQQVQADVKDNLPPELPADAFERAEEKLERSGDAVPEETDEEPVDEKVEVEEETEEVEEEPEKEVDEHKPKDEEKDERISSKIAQLMERERKVMEREQALKAKESEPKGMSIDEIQNIAKKNPLDAIKAIGLDTNTINEFLLNDGKPTEAMEKNQLASKLDNVEKKLTEFEKQQMQKNVEAAITNFKGSIGNHLEGNKTKYELLNSTSYDNLTPVDYVYNVIEGHHAEHQQVLNVDETCQHLESLFEKDFTSKLETEKGKALVKKLYGIDLVKTEVPKEKPVVSKTKPKANTLTNKQSATVQTPRSRTMSDDESVANAANFLKWTDSE